MTSTGAPSAGTAAPPRWGPFTLVCLAYVAATVGEQLLSPLFPTAAEDLGVDLAGAGLAFGVLIGTIAVFNLVGGSLLHRYGADTLVRWASVVTLAGSVAAATANGFVALVLAQVLLGAGAGLFFPAGLQAVAILAGPHRKGFAMGLYGVAFSLGLTAAALFGALGAAIGWRAGFWASAGLAGAAALAGLGLRARTTTPPERGVPWRAVLGLPTSVGAVGAVCQYGTVSFLTTFAVREWGLATSAAAILLAVGRIVSILAKLVSGASADRIGARASARRTGLVLVATGLAWVLLPGSWPVYALAAIFAGTVSSLFPIANLLAVERFGQRGSALGAYRSVQIAIGALAGLLIGLLGDVVGLRPTLAATVAAPLLLLWLCREPA